MAKKADQTFRINGRVIDSTTRQSIAGLRVEAWDKDLITNDLVGSSVTDQRGVFQMEFTSLYFATLFMDQQPDLFFKVFRGEEIIKNTEGSILWNVRAGETEIVIEIDASLELKARRALQPSGEDEPASLGDLLATLPLAEALSQEQGFAFAQLWVEYGDTDKLWKGADLSGLSRAVPGLKRMLALSEITGGNAPLVRALQTKFGSEQTETVEFLVALEPTDWIELVFEHGVPAGSGLDRDEYIETLQAAVKRKFPRKSQRG